MAKGPWDGDRVLHTTWRYKSGGAHFAWDVGTPRGTNLYAIGDGEIVDCADGEPDPAPKRYSGMPSNWIILKFKAPSGKYRGKTLYAYYQHLTKGGVKVKKGQKVKAGQLIGVSGSSGNSSGPHLHLVVLKPDYTMNRSSRYLYLSNSSMVTWSPSEAWKNTTYKDGTATTSYPVYLSKLKYGQKNSDSVKMLKQALKAHYADDPNVEERITNTGNYGGWVDYYVRKCQTDHGFGKDKKHKSNVGPKQAKHLGLKDIRR